MLTAAEDEFVRAVAHRKVELRAAYDAGTRRTPPPVFLEAGDGIVRLAKVPLRL